MTAFFVPGARGAASDAEKAYASIRDAAHSYTGQSPQPQRIFRLSFRHEGADLEAEVGKPHPAGGGTVQAILDLGRGSPYLIHCGPPDAPAMQLLVSKPVYSATEFGA